MKNISLTDFLPSINKTKINERFLKSSIDHLYHPEKSENIEKYFGKNVKSNEKVDFYSFDPTYINENIVSYQDVISYLENNGAVVNDPNRLFGQEYYSWQPPIDLDKFQNYQNYYWLPFGSTVLELGRNVLSFQGNEKQNKFSLNPNYNMSLINVEVFVNSEEYPILNSLNPQPKYWFRTGSEITIVPIPQYNDKIKIELKSTNQSNIDLLANQVSGIIEEMPGLNRTVSSGMRIKITNDYNSENNNKIFIIEGVGRKILFVDDTVNSGWDLTSWQGEYWDEGNEPFVNIDYYTIERGCLDQNPWSLSNRWFHIDLIDSPEKYDELRAKRPIIEFERNIELHKWGNHKRKDIDLIIDDIPNILDEISKITSTGFVFHENNYMLAPTSHTMNYPSPNTKTIIWKHNKYDIEVRINNGWDTYLYDQSGWDYGNFDSKLNWANQSIGYSEIYIKGKQIYDGFRLLILQDTVNPLANQKIFDVSGIESLGRAIPTLSLDGQDIYVGEPVDGDFVWDKTINKYYLVKNSQWILAQNKTTANQHPLFSIYDGDNISLEDSTKYPLSSFSGNKIFSQRLSEFSIYDDVLKNKPKRNNQGEFVYVNDFETEKYFQNRLEIITHRFWKRENLFETIWNINSITSKQKVYEYFKNQTDRWTYLLSNEFLSNPIVKLNGKELKPNQFYIDGNVLNLSIELEVTKAQIEVSMHGKPKDKKDIWVTENFVYTSNLVFDLKTIPYSPLTDETIRVFVNGLMVNKIFLQNNGLKKNQIRIDSGTLIPGDNIEFQIYVSDQKNDSEVFWEIPKNLKFNPSNQSPMEIGKEQLYLHFYEGIQKQDNLSGNPYRINNYRDTAKKRNLGQQLLQHSSLFSTLMWIVSNKNTNFVDVLASQRREYVRYKNKLIQKINEYWDTGKYFSQLTHIEILKTALEEIDIGKTAQSVFYRNHNGIDYWIPDSTRTVGLVEKTQPRKKYQNDDVYVIGHDNSHTLGYGDDRDDVVLEFEKLLYEFSTNDENLWVVLKHIPGKFRTTEYSLMDYNKTLANSFLVWTNENKIDAKKNIQYVENDPWTWNYTGSLDCFGQELYGSWRSIYLYFFDTEHVNETPWECLGFKSKPSWWEIEYGPSPYTRGNSVLWDDIRDGIIRQGPRQGQHLHLKRNPPSGSFYDILPVDSSGNLLNPQEANILNQNQSKDSALFSQDWKIGEIGAVEAVWRSSEQWQFVEMLVGFLLKPIEYLSSNWDLSLTKKNNSIFNVNTQTRSLTFKQKGLNKFYLNYNKLLNREENTETYYRLGEVKLSQTMSGFIKGENSKILIDSIGFLPFENYQTRLYKNTISKTVKQSGVVVEITGSGFKVYGYDFFEPRFLTIPHSVTGSAIKVRIGEQKSDFVVWAPFNLYSQGDIVERNNSFFKALQSHKSTTLFDLDLWVQIQLPDNVSVIELVKYSDRNPNNQIVEVPYGTEFSTVQEVYEFLLNYERYLVSVGWIFDHYEDENIWDWDLAGRQFAVWNLNNWDVGAFITLSPSAKNIKYQSDFGDIEPIEVVDNGLYNILDRSGNKIHPVETDIFRNGSNVSVQSDVGIYFLKLLKNQIQHIVVFDNTTIFGDIVYDHLFGLQQERFKISTVRSLNWSGRLEADGYMVRKDTMTENFEKTVNDFRLYYDFDNIVNVERLKRQSLHLIGYQKRDYFNSLFLNDSTQINFYQGFIKSKGTLTSFEKILRSNFVFGENEDFKVFEEWAIKTGRFGSIENEESITIKLNPEDLKQNPQMVEISTIDSEKYTAQITAWENQYGSNLEWSNDVWEKWFDEFLLDQDTDDVISPKIMYKKDLGMISSNRRFYETPSQSFELKNKNGIFLTNHQSDNKLPWAGPLGHNDFDLVYNTYEEMLGALSSQNRDESNSIETQNPISISDQTTVWIQNTKKMDFKTILINDSNQLLLDSAGNRIFGGQTSFPNSWSAFRFFQTEFYVSKTFNADVNNSGLSLAGITTSKKHDLVQGDLIYFQAESLNINVFTAVGFYEVIEVLSDNQFVINNAQAQNLNFLAGSKEDSPSLYKLVEIRFDSLKTTTNKYTVLDFLKKYNTPKSIWVDNGKDTTDKSLPDIGGWAEYSATWFKDEEKSKNIIYAELNIASTIAGIEKYNPRTENFSKWSKGKIIPKRYVNDIYPISYFGENPPTTITPDAVTLRWDLYSEPNPINNPYQIKLWTWYLGYHSFDDAVYSGINLDLLYEYTRFRPGRYEELTPINGKYHLGMKIKSAGFGAIAPSNRLLYATFDLESPLDPLIGDIWVYQDKDALASDDEIYKWDGTSWTIQALSVGTKLWNNQTNKLQELTTISPKTFVDITSQLIPNQFWFDYESNKPYEIFNVGGIIKPIKVQAYDYYWWDTEGVGAVWKQLIGNVWTATTPPTNNEIVFDLVEKNIKRKVASPVNWAAYQNLNTSLNYYLENQGTFIKFDGVSYLINDTINNGEYVYDQSLLTIYRFQEGTTNSLTNSVGSLTTNSLWIQGNKIFRWNSGFTKYEPSQDAYFINLIDSKIWKYTNSTRSILPVPLAAFDLWINSLDDLAYQVNASLQFIPYNPSSIGAIKTVFDDINRTIFEWDGTSWVIADLENRYFMDINDIIYQWIDRFMQPVTLLDKQVIYNDSANIVLQWDAVELNFKTFNLQNGYIYSEKHQSIFYWNNGIPTHNNTTTFLSDFIPEGLYFIDSELYEMKWTNKRTNLEAQTVQKINPSFFGYKAIKFEVAGIDVISQTVNLPKITQTVDLFYSIQSLGPYLELKSKEDKKVVSKLVTSAELFDSKNEFVMSFELFDPLKGFIPQIADKEISYKTLFDPAKYATGENDDVVWGKNQEGDLWFDLSTVSYVEYEKGSNRDRRDSWGEIACQKQIVVWEWVRSTDTPLEWSQKANNPSLEISGTPRSLTEYVRLEEYDNNLKKNIFYYYYWVRDRKDLPDIETRRLSCFEVNNIIQDPTAFGIKWFAITSENSFIFANSYGDIQEESYIRLNWKKQKNNNGIYHRHELIRQNDENWIPNKFLWSRIASSMVGFDFYDRNSVILESKPDNHHVITNYQYLPKKGIFLYNNKEISYDNLGNGLIKTSESIPEFESILVKDLVLPWPDPRLKQSEQFGLTFNTRKNIFQNQQEATESFIDIFNSLMKKNWLSINNPDWMSEITPVQLPSLVDYDLSVVDFDEMDLLIDDLLIPNNSRVLVNANIETNGYWSIWRYNNGKILLEKSQIFNVFDIIKSQDYVLKDIEHIQTFNTQNELQQSQIEWFNGDVVKVLIDRGFGNRWEKLQYEDGKWITIFAEKGTIKIELNTSNLDVLSNQYFVENEIVNKQQYIELLNNKSNKIELLRLFSSFEKNLLTNLEKNELFFGILNYCLAEQNFVDWIFKTSYLIIKGYEEKLTQEKEIVYDITENIVAYVNEVKAYHDKVRTFTKVLGYRDNLSLKLTDFDKGLIDNRVNYTISDLQDNKKTKDWASVSLINGNYVFDEKVRQINLNLAFDRVSCVDDDLAFREDFWDNIWDVYGWQGHEVVDSAYEPELFKLTVDSIGNDWSFSETNTSKAYKVIKNNNILKEHTQLQPVLGWEANRLWLPDHIEYVSVWDAEKKIETKLVRNQWRIYDISQNANRLNLRLSVSVNLNKNDVVSVKRSLTQRERIIKYNKFTRKNKYNLDLVDIPEKNPHVDGCMYRGVDLRTAPFNQGWDQDAWNELWDEWKLPFWYLDSVVYGGAPNIWEIYENFTGSTIVLSPSVQLGELGNVTIFSNGELLDPTLYTWNRSTLSINFIPAIIGQTLNIVRVYDYEPTNILTTTFLPDTIDPAKKDWATSIDGGKFIQPKIDAHRPEELVLLKKIDNLIIDVKQHGNPGLPIVYNNTYIASGTNSFGMSGKSLAHSNYIVVHLNGEHVDKIDYNIVNNNLIFNTSPTIGDIIDIKEYSSSSGISAIWKELGFDTIGQSVWNCGNVPSMNFIEVYENGLLVPHTTNNPFYTPSQKTLGEPITQHNLVVTTAPLSGTITIVVYANITSQGMMFGSDNILKINQQNAIGSSHNGTFNTNALVGPRHSLSRTDVTEFNVINSSGSVEPISDHTIVYKNGNRLIGPQHTYHQTQAGRLVYKLKTSTSMTQDHLAVVVDGSLIPPTDWYLVKGIKGIKTSGLEVLQNEFFENRWNHQINILENTNIGFETTQYNNYQIYHANESTNLIWDNYQTYLIGDIVKYDTAIYQANQNTNSRPGGIEWNDVVYLDENIQINTNYNNNIGASRTASNNYSNSRARIGNQWIVMNTIDNSQDFIFFNQNLVVGKTYVLKLVCKNIPVEEWKPRFYSINTVVKYFDIFSGTYQFYKKVGIGDNLTAPPISIIWAQIPQNQTYSTIDISNNYQVIGSILSTDEWSSYDFEITPTSISNRIEFVETNSAYNRGVWIDSVYVYEKEPDYQINIQIPALVINQNIIIADLDNDGMISVDDFVNSINQQISDIQAENENEAVVLRSQEDFSISEVNNIPLIGTFFGKSLASITTYNSSTQILRGNRIIESVDLSQTVNASDYRYQEIDDLLLAPAYTGQPILNTNPIFTPFKDRLWDTYPWDLDAWDFTENVVKIFVTVSVDNIHSKHTVHIYPNSSGNITKNEFVSWMNIWGASQQTFRLKSWMDNDIIYVGGDHNMLFELEDVNSNIISVLFNNHYNNITYINGKYITKDEFYPSVLENIVFRVGLVEIPITILDLDSSGSIEIEDFVDSFNNSIPVQRLQLEMVYYEGLIKVKSLTEQSMSFGNEDIVSTFLGLGIYQSTHGVVKSKHTTNSVFEPIRFKLVNNEEYLVDVPNKDVIDQNDIVTALNSIPNTTSLIVAGSIVIQSSLNIAALQVDYLDHTVNYYNPVSRFFGNSIAMNSPTENSKFIHEIGFHNQPTVLKELVLVDYTDQRDWEHVAGKFRLFGTVANSDNLEFITFNDTNYTNIRTENFDGNIDGKYVLSSETIQPYAIWNSLNGKLQNYGKDWDLTTQELGWDIDEWDTEIWDHSKKYTIIEMNDPQNSTDKMAVTYFASKPRDKNVSWRYYQNPQREIENIRTSTNGSYTLINDVLVNSTEIDLRPLKQNNYIRPMTPNKQFLQPGTIWINGERIVYWEIEEYTDALGVWWKLKQLERGVFASMYGNYENSTTTTHIMNGVSNSISFVGAYNRIIVKKIVNNNDVILHERNTTIEALFLSNQYVNNNGWYRWDYEIVANTIVFRNTPESATVIQIEIYQDDIISNLVSHSQGDTVLNANPTERFINYYQDYEFLSNKEALK